MMLHNLFRFVVEQLHSNQFFAGGAMAGIILAILNYGRAIANRILSFLWKRMTVSMKVHSEDPLYNPLMAWLNKHRFDYLVQHYRMKSNYEHSGPSYDDYDYFDHSDSYETEVKAIFGPDYGNYFFRFANRWLKVFVVHEEESAAGTRNDSTQTRDFLTIRYLGFSKAIMNKIVEGAIAEYHAQQNDKLTIYQSTGGGWREMGYIDRYIEGSEHVVLDGNLLAEIEGEVQRFFDSRKWYKEHGIPWRRGFMLQGPPGTGKTSLCRHLASKYKMNIYVVSPSSYTSETLGSIMRYVRPRSILLFEDIDRSLSMAQQKKKKRGDNEDDENSLDKSLAEMLRGNLGVLLNAIDGIAPAEGMMLVMTSNDTKELDPALTRPGRVDRTFHLGRCTRSQAMKMFRKFFPNASAAEEMGFIQGIADDQYSPAELQEKLISAAGSSVFVQSTPVDNLL